jgi:Eukaryotic cytochrome b561
MVLGILVFMPLGALSLRVLSVPNIVVYHSTAQLFFLTLVFTGFALGVYCFTTTYRAYGSQPHFILGTTVVAMLLLQPIFGFIHHSLYRKLGRKTFASYLHIWWGRIIFILALTNGVLGLRLTAIDYGSQRQGIIAYSVVVGVMGTLYIAVTLYTAIKDKK